MRIVEPTVQVRVYFFIVLEDFFGNWVFLLLLATGVEMLNLLYGRLVAYLDRLPDSTSADDPDVDAAISHVLGVVPTPLPQSNRTIGAALDYFSLKDKYTVEGKSTFLSFRVSGRS